MALRPPSGSAPEPWLVPGYTSLQYGWVLNSLAAPFDFFVISCQAQASRRCGIRQATYKAAHRRLDWQPCWCREHRRLCASSFVGIRLRRLSASLKHLREVATARVRVCRRRVIWRLCLGFLGRMAVESLSQGLQNGFQTTRAQKTTTSEFAVN